MSDVKHILRYGTNAEQKYIRDHLETFDCLAINANMVAHSSKAVSSFVLELIQKRKSFFIDPLTHSFQHSIDKIQSYSKKKGKKTLKSSIEKLIAQYGEPIESKVNNSTLIKPEDFTDDNIGAFCEKVIEFQLKTVSENLKEDGLSEYLEFDNNQTIDQEFQPHCIIPPYFYINNVDWINLNVKFIKATKELYPENKLYAEIVLSPKDIKLFSKKIIKDYSDLKIDGVMLWLDGFNEHDTDGKSLDDYINILKDFRDRGVEVINLYGSFFSILLTSNYIKGGRLLSGVGHGLEYGEARAVVPVGGGIPNNKYYFYNIHKRVNYTEMTKFLNDKGFFIMNPRDASERYYSEICACKVCKGTIKNDIRNFHFFESTNSFEVKYTTGRTQRRQFANQTTKQICVTHYLQNKLKEFENVRVNKLSSIIIDINPNIDEVKDSNSGFSLLHLYKWVSIIESKGLVE